MRNSCRQVLILTICMTTIPTLLLHQGLYHQNKNAGKYSVETITCQHKLH